jgi:TorA maturation chaperone TorD
MTTAVHTDALAARGIAYALLARCLSIDTAALTDETVLADLRAALREAGHQHALQWLPATPAADADDLRRRWVRWFDQGRVAPYECSNTPPSPGGHTPRLADIAGFYRAFGMQVHGDRPDHVVAELEFASWASLSEAAAWVDGDEEAAERCAAATRSFLRDHLGRWLDAFAARVGGIDALAPWLPYASAAARVVADDAIARNVVPLHSFAVLPDDASLLPDEDPIPTCGGDPFD